MTRALAGPRRTRRLCRTNTNHGAWRYQPTRALRLDPSLFRVQSAHHAAPPRSKGAAEERSLFPFSPRDRASGASSQWQQSCVNFVEHNTPRTLFLPRVSRSISLVSLPATNPPRMFTNEAHVLSHTIPLSPPPCFFLLTYTGRVSHPHLGKAVMHQVEHTA